MNPSYDNSFGSFQQPVVSAQGGNFQQVGERKSKKKILAIILLILLMGGGVVAGIMMIINKKQEFRNNIEELYSLLEWASYSGQCSLVAEGADNADITAEDYNQVIEQCRDKTEQTKKLLARLKDGDDSEEYRKLYSNLSDLASRDLLFDQDLDEQLSIYQAWHDWRIFANETETIPSSEKMSEVADKLRETGVSEIVKYIDEWTDKRDDLAVVYLLANYGLDENAFYSNEYKAMLSDYKFFISKRLSDVDNELKLGGEDKYDLWEGVYLLKNYVEDNI